jgi:hypothetical protein
MWGMAENKSAGPPSLKALREQADRDLAQLKAAYADREAALRRYETASSAIADAEAAIERAKGEQGRAMAELLATGMTVASVAELLGVDQRRVRAVRPGTAEEKVPPRLRPVAKAPTPPGPNEPHAGARPPAGGSGPSGISVVA